jgi:adenylylsulfate kinase
MSEQQQSSNTTWHQATVTRERREHQNGHRSFVLWFTGLSGSGKSTLAHALEERLFQRGCRTMVLDGDNVRHGLCGDLGFTDEDRRENLRRIGEVAKLYLETGVLVLTAFISPFADERRRVRSLMPHGDFLEIYCDTPLAVCEERDVKGLYQKARQGLIPHFTGISSPYESPTKPELVVPTGTASLEASVDMVFEFLLQRGLFDVRT